MWYYVRHRMCQQHLGKGRRDTEQEDEGEKILDFILPSSWIQVSFSLVLCLSLSHCELVAAAVVVVVVFLGGGTPTRGKLHIWGKLSYRRIYSFPFILYKWSGWWWWWWGLVGLYPVLGNFDNTLTPPLVFHFHNWRRRQLPQVYS